MKEDRAALNRLLAENDTLKRLAEADLQESMALWKREQLEKQLRPIQPREARLPNEQSEMGLAERFSQLNQGSMCYVPAWGWMVWDGKLWNRGALEMARRACIRYLDEVIGEAFAGAIERQGDPNVTEALKWARRCRTARMVRSILELAQAHLYTENRIFDTDPWTLNTQGGLVDLRTGQMRPHDPLAYCSMICATDPAPLAPHTPQSDRWGDFLRAVTCDDPELQHYLQLLFGMAAVGKVYQEGIAIFYGGGSNGKSTLCNPIRDALGSYAATLAPEVLMVQRGRDEVRGLAPLRGRRLVLASETEEGQRLSASVVKRLASTDHINARELYREPFDFVPSHTLVMFTNFLPKISGTDNGIWRRIHAVPFNARFGQGGSRAVPNFGEVLFREEGAAILRWVIDGACMYHKSGCRLPDPPACVREATAAYRSAENWVENFISERCEVGMNYSAQGGQLYAAYRAWAQANGEYARRSRDFAAALELHGFDHARTKTGALWYGLRVLPGVDDYLPGYR